MAPGVWSPGLQRTRPQCLLGSNLPSRRAPRFPFSGRGATAPTRQWNRNSLSSLYSIQLTCSYLHTCQPSTHLFFKHRKSWNNELIFIELSHLYGHWCSGLLLWALFLTLTHTRHSIRVNYTLLLSRSETLHEWSVKHFSILTLDSTVLVTAKLLILRINLWKQQDDLSDISFFSGCYSAVERALSHASSMIALHSFSGPYSLTAGHSV